MSGEPSIEETILMLRMQADQVLTLDPTDPTSDQNIQDFCGGNFDDAYALGFGDGQTEMARLIVQLIDGGKLKI